MPTSTSRPRRLCRSDLDCDCGRCCRQVTSQSRQTLDPDRRLQTAEECGPRTRLIRVLAAGTKQLRQSLLECRGSAELPRLRPNTSLQHLRSARDESEENLMSCSCPSAMPPMRDVVSLFLFVLKSLSLQARQDIKTLHVSMASRRPCCSVCPT